MSYVTSTRYHKHNSIEWSFVGNDLSLWGVSGFEIDIKPPLTKENVIIDLLFSSRVLPEGVSLTSDIYFESERWKLVWPDKIGLTVLPKLRKAFQEYHSRTSEFETGWQKDNTKVFDRETLILREKWDTRKRQNLGGRSLDDIKTLGFGPHEIQSVGFVWYGPVSSKRTYEVQTYPYSDSENFNQAIRTFLQRGISLNEALSLNNEHMKNLNDQLLIASALILLGGGGAAGRGGKAPVSIFEQAVAVAVGITNHPKNPLTPNTESFFEALTKRFRDAPIEAKIQAISKIKPMEIPKLRALP
jgi:hypothetical protein